MSLYFEIHPENPQPRLIRQAVQVLRQSGVIVYPTDSCYALGCLLESRSAINRIIRLRKLPKDHHFTLMCNDLGEVSRYAKLDNESFRLVKRLTPGPYTFILPVTSKVPRQLWKPKARTIGVRIPDNEVALALLEELGEPMMSTTLIMPDAELPMTDPYRIRLLLESHVDLVIDAGFCGLDSSTVVDLSRDYPQILRQGVGEVDWLEKH